jgi:Mg-chelatase subunit ChlD
MIGTVLLIGFVVFASFVLVVMGSGPIQEADERNTKQSAETLLQEVDSRLATLSSNADTPTVELRLGDSLPGDLDTEQYGYFNLTVNGNGTCSFEEDLHQFRYVGPEGEQIGYEAGGVFRGSTDSSIAITSPDVKYRAGALDVTLINLTGSVDQTTNEARLNASASANRTREIEEALLQGECMRPDNVTLRVQSQFHHAWHDYLATEMDHPNAKVDSFDSNQTVRVYLPQDALPRSVDDELNTVVNLTEGSTATDPGADYMDYVALNNSAPDLPPAGSPIWDVNLSKDAGNNYTVFVEPLTQGDLDVGRIRNVGNVTNSTRPPLDVMLVIDESGSMDNDPDGDGATKAREAKDAAKQFVGDLNETKDRAGVVSYDTDPQYRVTDNGSYLSGFLDDVNESIEDIPDHPSGGTRGDRGHERANSVLDLRGNETRDKVVILLTDGVNNGCDSVADDDDPYDCSANQHAIDFANNTSAAGGTVYSIGFGADTYLDEAYLETAANLTGGSYHQAENSDELEGVFEDIRKEIANEKVIARTPMTSNVTNVESGQIFTPQIAGDTDGVGNVTTGSHTFLNVNDPQAPSRFSHAFAIQDGDPLYFNVTQYECGTWQSTGRTRTHGGETYKLTSCTDIQETNESFKPRLDDDGDGVYEEGAPVDPRNGVLTDGDNASALLEQTPGWWQDDINLSLSAFPDVEINKTKNPPNGRWGTVSMKSNQALVVFDLPDGPESTNVLVLLYQVGLAESEARSEGVINVQVANVTVE